MSVDPILEPLAVQWRAEHRIRCRIVWENQDRIKELEAMHLSFFDEEIPTFGEKIDG